MKVMVVAKKKIYQMNLMEINFLLYVKTLFFVPSLL